jgi:hypothetical protein
MHSNYYLENMKEETAVWVSQANEGDIILRLILVGFWLASGISGSIPVPASCAERSNIQSNPVQQGEFLNYLCNCQLLKNGAFLSSYLLTTCKLFVKHRMKMGVYCWLLRSTTLTFVGVFGGEARTLDIHNQ